MANFFELNGQDVKITYRNGGNIGPTMIGGSRLIALTYDDTARDLHAGPSAFHSLIQYLANILEGVLP